MKPNIGTIDRVIRLVLGIAILAVGYYYRSWWGLIGIIPILTALVRFCPLYVPLHLSTCPEKTSSLPKT